MREVVICRPLRTPVGRFGGGLKDVPPQELAAIVVRAGATNSSEARSIH